MLENLKLLRSTAGISQKTLADSIGVSQQSINKYENHNIEPDIATLSSIADYFHVSIDFLVGRTNCQLPPAEDGNAGISFEEESLLCRYRALTPKQKKAVQEVLDSYFYSPYPMGFLDCQFQESRHMSSRFFSAFQPSTRSLLAGSA